MLDFILTFLIQKWLFTKALLQTAIGQSSLMPSVVDGTLVYCK